MYPLPIVKITFNGQPLSKKVYDERPEIHHLYPTKEVFMERLYLPLLKKAQESNTEQLLEISEHSIKINGALHNIS
jgi:hypothetical protein